MNLSDFRKLYTTIPELPGIYKYFDNTEKLIYVGKAKNLKKRINSYFVKGLLNQKTIELVKKINKITIS